MIIGKYYLHQLIYVVCPIIYKMFIYSRGCSPDSFHQLRSIFGVVWWNHRKIWLPWVGWGPNLQDNEVKVQDPMGQVLSSNLVFVVKQAAGDVFVGNHGGTKCTLCTKTNTWRDGIPNYIVLVVNYHGDRKFPKDRVVGPLPNGIFMAYKWGLLTTY